MCVMPALVPPLQHAAHQGAPQAQLAAVSREDEEVYDQLRHAEEALASAEARIAELEHNHNHAGHTTYDNVGGGGGFMAARHLREGGAWAGGRSGSSGRHASAVPGEAWGTPRGVGEDEERSVLMKVLEALSGAGGEEGDGDERLRTRAARAARTAAALPTLDVRELERLQPRTLRMIEAAVRGREGGGRGAASPRRGERETRETRVELRDGGGAGGGHEVLSISVADLEGRNDRLMRQLVDVQSRVWQCSREVDTVLTEAGASNQTPFPTPVAARCYDVATPLGKSQQGGVNNSRLSEEMSQAATLMRSHVLTGEAAGVVGTWEDGTKEELEREVARLREFEREAGGIKELEKEVARLRSEATTSRAVAEELSREAQQARGEVDGAREQAAFAKGEAAAAKADVRTTRLLAEELSKAVDEAKEHAERARMELQEAKDARERAHKERQAADLEGARLRGGLEEASRGREELGRQLEELRSRLVQAEGAPPHPPPRSPTSRGGPVLGVDAGLDRQVAELRSELRRAGELNGRLLDEASEASEEIDVARGERDALMREAQSLAQQLAASLGEREALEREARSLQALVAALSGERDGLRQAVGGVGATAASLAVMQGERDKALSKCDQVGFSAL